MTRLQRLGIALAWCGVGSMVTILVCERMYYTAGGVLAAAIVFTISEYYNMKRIAALSFEIKKIIGLAEFLRR